MTSSVELCCLQCGYNLTGLPTEARCPECGFGFERAAIEEIAEIERFDADATHRGVSVWSAISLACTLSAFGVRAVAQTSWWQMAGYMLPFGLLGLLACAAIVLFLRLTRSMSPWFALFIISVGYMTAAVFLMNPVIAHLAGTGSLCVAAYTLARRQSRYQYSTASLSRTDQWRMTVGGKAAGRLFIAALIGVAWMWFVPM